MRSSEVTVHNQRTSLAMTSLCFPSLALLSLFSLVGVLLLLTDSVTVDYDRVSFRLWRPTDEDSGGGATIPWEGTVLEGSRIKLLKSWTSREAPASEEDRVNEAGRIIKQPYASRAAATTRLYSNAMSVSIPWNRKREMTGRSPNGEEDARLAGHGGFRPAKSSGPKSRPEEGPSRSHKFDLTDFGAKGDGVTDNSRAFQNAMYAVSTVYSQGGGQLYIPPGRYLTGCFNLTSRMTLFLARGATVLANPNPFFWPVLPPLPSYGQGLEMKGPRHSSFIFGQNLTDVIITGDNGTVDGQGQAWWDWARRGQLNFSRGPLVELLWSKDIIISNVVLRNSPYWAVHPVYCSNVTVRNITIAAPQDSPNTGGIYPDSSVDVLVEKCNISTGDDCIGVKSGWDDFGITYGKRSKGVVVRDCRLLCSNCSALSIGSEMSGGVEDSRFEMVHIIESRVGFELRTAPGRGGFVSGVLLKDVLMAKVQVAFSFRPNVTEHPEGSTSTVLPRIFNFTFQNITGCEIGMAGVLEGLPRAPFGHINITNVHLDLAGGEGWRCSNVDGTARDVSPPICKEFQPGGENQSKLRKSRQQTELLLSYLMR